MFTKMKIGAKLIVITATMIIISSSVITIAAIVQASNALSHEAFQLLNAVHGEKQGEVMNYLTTLRKQIEVLSHSKDTLHAIDDLERYYSEMDIQSNEDFDMSSSAPNLSKTYTQIYKETDKQLGKYVEVFDYYDIFIISYDHGHVMYSHRKNDDLGLNLKHGIFKNSNLAQAWSLAEKNTKPVIVDLASYEPSGGAPAMFCAAPVIVNGVPKGIIAIQVNNEEINHIVGDAEGMGKTGEIYCVGDDHIMRTEKREFREGKINESGILGQEVRAVPR